MGDDNGSKINIPELAEVLSQTSIHFNYILMDACLMSQVEVAYEL
ncbi:clostripain-related cysteine peptidase [Bacteroides thetaiotaomicron]|nr:clostripain-related cysteine peptidase [Bacteroides thetaiotaomicron]